MECRNCSSQIKSNFLDLGTAPYSNAYLTEDDLEKSEVHHPLRVVICKKCWLVQTTDSSDEKNIFNKNYAYFSSTSTSWLSHAKDYVAEIISILKLNKSSFIVEIASNDGYLLKNFVELGIPNLGVEPTRSTAMVARKKGVKVIEEFFSKKLAIEIKKDYRKADLIIGNNVYAHVPNINDFTQGIKNLLAENGVVTLEFPHILKLIKYNQFDTIYHEHYSYFSLIAIIKIFKNNGLKVWKVQEIDTHGGSLRIYGCHSNSIISQQNCVRDLILEEKKFGLNDIKTYSKIQENAETIKDELLKFLIKQKKFGKKTVAYGAAAKGNTLLNFAGIRGDLIDYVVDAAPSKQGKYMPGSRLKIYPPEYLKKNKPDNILILPWNIANEIKKNLKRMGIDNCNYLVSIPKLKIIN